MFSITAILMRSTRISSGIRNFPCRLLLSYVSCVSNVYNRYIWFKFYQVPKLNILLLGQICLKFVIQLGGGKENVTSLYNSLEEQRQVERENQQDAQQFIRVKTTALLNVS